VLLDPFEKEFHLPAVLVKLGDGEGGQVEVVGQKDESFAGRGVEITNAAQLVGIMLSGVEAFENHGLVAEESGRLVDGVRVETPEVEILLGASHKEGGREMKFVKATEVDITAIHHVDGARFEEKSVEDIDVVNSAGSNNDKGGNASAQIQERVEFDGGFVFPKFRPRKKGETKVDGGGVQRVNRLVEFQPKIVVGVKLPGDADKDLGEVGVDAPRPILVGIGQSAARDATSNSGVVKFGFHRPQAGFDVAQAFPISQLGESHAEKLIVTGKLSDSLVATITAHAFVEIVLGKEVHQLRKDDTSGVHQPSLSTQKWKNHGRFLSAN